MTVWSPLANNAVAEEDNAVIHVGDISLFHIQREFELTFQKRPARFAYRFSMRVGSFDDHDEVSSPGESHPEALSEPYVNLSAHTAPALEPRRTPICQCANSVGSRRAIRATQCVALRKWPRSFLYFRSAQRASDRSSCRIGG